MPQLRFSCFSALCATLLTATLVLLATPALTAPAAGAAASEETTRVRVLSWNIRFGEYGVANVARDIRRTGAKVVVLNEVDDRRRTGGVHQARRLARLLDMHVEFRANTRTRFGTRGNAVLSAYPIVSANNVRLPNPGDVEPRGLLRARIKIGAVTIRVEGTHLSPGKGRLAQARAVRSLVGTPDCATIVAGDLNFTPDRREYDVVTTHLRDVWAAKGEGRGLTAPAPRPRHRIDYVLVARAAPVSTWVARRGASDHRGVVANFDIRTSRSC
jgi:endonuclease/exonuclease/phosphatase family metal-dependent hydrolase